MDAVRLFLVRVWSRFQDDEGFRASVRPLDGEQPLLFSRPEQIAAFLKSESDQPGSERLLKAADGVKRQDLTLSTEPGGQP
jgi:hypothetical protein